MIQVTFKRKSQGIEKNELFSQGTENCQNLRYRNNSIEPPLQISPPLEGEFLISPLSNDPPPSNILPDSAKKEKPLIKSYKVLYNNFLHDHTYV